MTFTDEERRFLFSAVDLLIDNIRRGTGNTKELLAALALADAIKDKVRPTVHDL